MGCAVLLWLERRVVFIANGAVQASPLLSSLGKWEGGPQHMIKAAASSIEFVVASFPIFMGAWCGKGCWEEMAVAW